MATNKEPYEYSPELGQYVKKNNTEKGGYSKYATPCWALLVSFF